MTPPAGAKNGIKNGLELLLDVESQEYAFFPRSSQGFSLAVSGYLVRPVIRQHGGHTSNFGREDLSRFPREARLADCRLHAGDTREKMHPP